MSEILKSWPVTWEPRQSQIKAFEWLEQNKDKKYLFVEAPVGAGKSLIGMTLANYFGGRSYTLTPQRILQKQYVDEFEENKYMKLKTQYGRANYKCDKAGNCEIGATAQMKCSDCPYKEARDACTDAKHSVLNYDLMLINRAYTEAYGNRKLLVLDECHRLENILTEFDAVGISINQMNKLGVKWQQITDIREAVTWIKDEYYDRLNDEVEHLESIATPLKGNAHLTPDEIRILKDYNNLAAHKDEIDELILTPLDVIERDFVFVHDKLSLKFKRATAATSFKRWINPIADKFLFMSSTILNYEGYCRDNGIDPEQAAFISLDSEFPEDNRPVYFMPQMKFNYEWDKPQNTIGRKNTLAFIQDQLLEMHSEDKGIIHTANFKIAEWLVENMKSGTHKIFHHNPGSEKDRNTVIDEFQTCNKPAILISPSITEGLDLKGDLARFAIFVKVPYPYLGDQWINHRKNESPEWYKRQAVIDIIQGCGRVVRSADDHGNVYILDESFEYLYNSSQNIIPDWWKEGYRVLG